MRKNIFIALAALMTLAVSCKKNNIEKTDNGSTSPVVQAENSSVARLLKFKKQVEYYKANPDVRDGETMSIDEAVWNLENLFNVTYTFPEYSYSGLVTQEFELSLGADNGRVLSSRVAALYEELKDGSRELYANDGFTENKGFLTLHAEVGDTRGGEVLKVKVTTGERTDTPSHEFDSLVEWGPFMEGDDWVYGEELGMCDDPYVAGDAAQEITREINERIGLGHPSFNSGERLAYINRTRIPFTPNKYHDMYCTEDPERKCIVWQDMNVYWNYYRRIAYYLIPTTDPDYIQGEELIHVNIYGNHDYNAFDVENKWWHEGTAEYGERVMLDKSVFGDAVDLIEN